jgi:hypothetical protein
MSKIKLLAVVFMLALVTLFYCNATRSVEASKTNPVAVTLDTTLPVNKIETPPDGWSFRNHIIPVMTKLGCNQGACHGAAAGSLCAATILSWIIKC